MTIMGYEKILINLFGCQNVLCDIIMDPVDQTVTSFKRLKVTTPVVIPASPVVKQEKPPVRTSCQARATQTSSLPTWGQLKQLTGEAQQVVLGQGVEVAPTMLFVALLSLVSIQGSMVGANTYWTYFPDPPVVNPAAWKEGLCLFLLMIQQ
uniref:Uncharacterized protein n=1 Tax=Molossus molossus TaxID=27622 RepID=A0A7J8GQH2_MOLMO|nr:hypothetical protein HJG59_011311 [Molossus molossus]